MQNDYNKIVFEDVELNIPNYWTKQSSSSDNDVYVIGKNNLSVMNIMKEHFNCKYNENNLVAAKDNIEKLITSWYINIDGINNLRFLNSEEYKNKNGVYGIKYMYSMKLVANNNEFDINGQCFVFLSKDGYSINVCRLIFPQSDSSFDYSGDFSKLIDTIEYK